ncbi:hypothetical protein [Rhizobium esperanzae]|nr:hypothetical protein [Rhizobium esperanzae]
MAPIDMTPHLAFSAPRVSGVPVGCSFALATPGKSKSSRLSMANRIDAARESIGRAIFESLDNTISMNWYVLTRKFADEISGKISVSARKPQKASCVKILLRP